MNRVIGYYQPAVPLLAALIQDTQSFVRYREWIQLRLIEDVSTAEVPIVGTLKQQTPIGEVAFPILATDKIVPVTGSLGNIQMPEHKVEGDYEKYDFEDRDGHPVAIIYKDPNKLPGIKKNCAVVTLSRAYIEYENDGSLLGWIQYDKRLYYHPRLPRISRAALMTHEHIQIQALRRNLHDSRATSEVTTALIRSNNRLTDEQMKALLSKWGFDKPPANELVDRQDE